ncbi:Myotubularin-related protein 14 isoform X2 [Oopsacas minuta]|uniref:Myotubularin-related protein 14 isoform X2 n=1 Tax=Oopsacas minuta TaxID=111878 RepID=A0AAV7K2Y1_9METZ|nr:Myotubularin-related protein 14 isoform X2 [Oopsacas minuta]
MSLHIRSIIFGGQKVNNAIKLTQLFLTARFARARSRFAVPVLIYKDKNLCRGATLSVGVEQFGRRGWDFFSTGGVGVEEDGATNLPDKSRLGRQEELCDKVRGQDIKLLKELRVRLICDLMYQQKKLKFMLPVASSEKVDKAGRYREFLLASLPYPGCESFRGYQSKYLNSDKLRFNWKVEKVDAILKIPDGVVHKPLGVNWAEYKEWSIKDMTSCYTRLLLYQLENSNGGVFVHCISGWDRTPMFISLLRLSLWADGLAHASLNPLEMLFFTVAYDWRLFGHKLSDRNSKSEEIFYFGMDYLEHMTDSEFSIHCGLQKSDKCPELVKIRRDKLLEVRRLFIGSYNQYIIPKNMKFSHIS